VPYDPPRIEALSVEANEKSPELVVRGGWESLFAGQGAGRETGREASRLDEVLCAYLRARRWFGGKARRLRAVKLLEAVPMPCRGGTAYLSLIGAEYLEGDPETYLLPLALASGEEAARLAGRSGDLAIARLQGGEKGILYDAAGEPSFAAALLEAIAAGRRYHGPVGEILGTSTRAFAAVHDAAHEPLAPRLLRGEQTNTSIAYGSRMILKLYRRIEEGVSPELEIGRFLAERAPLAQIVPALLGALEHRGGARGATATLAVLHAYVPDAQDAWVYTRRQLLEYFEKVRAARAPRAPDSPPLCAILELAQSGAPAAAREWIGAYLDAAGVLGKRTAELHAALASGSEDPAFSPEAFSGPYQRSLHESRRELTREVFELLARRLGSLPADTAAHARALLGREEEICRRFQALAEREMSALCIRCHGDYHLGQVLRTGEDFRIIDFEGEPTRPLSERRRKHSPLRDVAGMLRSFHYAAFSALRGDAAGTVDDGPAAWLRDEDRPRLEPWARFWQVWVSVSFLKSYLEAAGEAAFLARSREETEAVLGSSLLEKAIYELGYELSHRPDWVDIPVRGLLELLDGAG
jgi:maltose alpha-D-glucosyltransferase/alpha-amylase